MVGVVHHGKTVMETACTLRAKEGLTVLTDTPDIAQDRTILFELYLAEAPKSAVVKEMAARYGVTKTRFLRRVDTGDPLGGACILCGLCVRVCNEIMGAGAINFINRGPYTVVNTPFTEPSRDCYGCGACAAVCPTHAVSLEDRGGERILHSWSETKVPLSQCVSCGKYFAPAALEKSVLSRIQPPLRDDLAGLCPACWAKSWQKKRSLQQREEIRAMPKSRAEREKILGVAHAIERSTHKEPEKGFRVIITGERRGGKDHHHGTLVPPPIKRRLYPSCG